MILCKKGITSLAFGRCICANGASQACDARLAVGTADRTLLVVDVALLGICARASQLQLVMPSRRRFVPMGLGAVRGVRRGLQLRSAKKMGSWLPARVPPSTLWPATTKRSTPNNWEAGAAPPPPPSHRAMCRLPRVLCVLARADLRRCLFP